MRWDLRALRQGLCQSQRWWVPGLRLAAVPLSRTCPCPPHRPFNISAIPHRAKDAGTEAKEETALVASRGDLFDKLRTKDKETFNTAVEMFHGRDKHARGHVEFIYSALKHMKTFGVHRDLESYKRLVDIFPKGRFIPSNMWQVEFMHFPKQQQCAVDLLEQMEDMGVMPDKELNAMMENVFGTQGFPIRKLMRMAYWMPKFKNLSPWPIPEPLPDDAFELAKIAVKRITSVDLETRVTCFNTSELEDSVDETWIVSGQSPEQQALIEKHPADRPVYVEGAFRVWIQRVCINYFILRAEPLPRPMPKPKDPDDVGILASIFKEDYIASELSTVPSVHSQEDGVILGVCATGTSSRDSILSWIRFLERTNPRLGKDIAVLFTLKSPIGPTDELEIGTGAGDTDPQQRLSSFDGHAPESRKKEEPFPSLDPANPQLSQIGVDDNWSESRFPNWPHHFNRSRSGERDTQPLSAPTTPPTPTSIAPEEDASHQPGTRRSEGPTKT